MYHKIITFPSNTGTTVVKEKPASTITPARARLVGIEGLASESARMLSSAAGTSSIDLNLNTSNTSSSTSALIDPKLNNGSVSTNPQSLGLT